jgi:hypothetical protein
MMHCSGTPCSFSTLTACTTVFPVLMMGSKTKEKWEIRRWNRRLSSYTSEELDVSRRHRGTLRRQPLRRTCRHRFPPKFFRFLSTDSNLSVLAPSPRRSSRLTHRSFPIDTSTRHRLRQSASQQSILNKEVDWDFPQSPDGWGGRHRTWSHFDWCFCLGESSEVL